METSERAVIQLELKYCERCGGLFLRRQREAEVFCGSCTDQMSTGWTPPKSRRQPRLPVNRSADRLLQLVPSTGRREQRA